MKYEFKIVSFSETDGSLGHMDWQTLQSQLNELGQQGWDVSGLQPLAVGGPHAGVVVFLRRPLAQ